MRNSLILFLSLCLPTLSNAADNWPQFRGPDGKGQSDATGLPVKWSEKENVVWKTPIHDKGWSSPVVWGKQIWLTTAKEHPGSWWPDWIAWIKALDAAEAPARAPGGGTRKPIEDAPGSFVRVKA